jgi:putative hemolysin
MSIEILNREAQGEMVQSSKATVAPVASDVLGRIGNLETRLARTAREIDAAQAVRYRVFVEEMNAQLPADAMRRQRDIDGWDAICDHLLVLDRSLDTLLARHPDKRFMELGRSCVLPEYRNKRTVELLWQGNWAYALKHGMGAMIGCASFPGVLPEQHALALSFLYHNVLAKDEWTVGALPSLARNMDLMPVEAVNPKKALMALPPLIKGYLRLGAMVGSTAVVDQAFNTTDVLIVLPIASISDRYVNYYGADAGRFAS